MADPRIQSVPDGSKVYVSRGPGETGYQMQAELRSFGALIKRWRHDEIGDRRRYKKLEAAKKAYTVTDEVVFTSPSPKTATFIVEVEEPDGRKRIRRVTHTGTRGDTAQGRVRISMKQTGGA